MNMPIIRIEVENLRSTILHAFEERHEEIVAMVEQELDKYLTDDMILQETLKAIPSLIEKEIKSLTGGVVFDVFHDEELRSKLRDIIVKAFENNANG